PEAQGAVSVPNAPKDGKIDPHIKRLHGELQKLRKELRRTSLSQATSPGHTHSGVKDEGKTGRITITKPIDKCSPRLFQASVTKYENKWAVISIRESGRDRKPWLVIELQKVTVGGFRWDVNPGDAEGASHFESVDFDFHKILIKYTGQDQTGIHTEMDK